MSERSRVRSRPLSPHLQIYRPTITMMMSIAHRLTGAVLYLGTLVVTSWLIALRCDGVASGRKDLADTSRSQTSLDGTLSGTQASASCTNYDHIVSMIREPICFGDAHATTTSKSQEPRPTLRTA